MRPIQVVNLSDKLPDSLKSYDRLVIDRRSALGNPFELTDKDNDQMREQILRAYAKYLWGVIKFSIAHSEGKSPLAIAELVAAEFQVPVSQKWRSKSWSTNSVLLDLKELFLAADDPLADGLILQCWCAPKRCHGDVLVKVVEWYKAESQQAKALACRLTSIQLSGSRV